MVFPSLNSIPYRNDIKRNVSIFIKEKTDYYDGKCQDS